MSEPSNQWNNPPAYSLLWARLIASLTSWSIQIHTHTIHKHRLTRIKKKKKNGVETPIVKKIRFSFLSLVI